MEMMFLISFISILILGDEIFHKFLTIHVNLTERDQTEKSTSLDFRVAKAGSNRIFYRAWNECFAEKPYSVMVTLRILIPSF